MFDNQFDNQPRHFTHIRNELFADSEQALIAEECKSAYKTGFTLINDYGKFGKYTKSSNRDDEYIRQALGKYGKSSASEFIYLVVHPEKLDQEGTMSPRVILIPNGKDTNLESPLILVETRENHGKRVLTTGLDHTYITEETTTTDEMGSQKMYEDVPLTSERVKYFSSMLTQLKGHFAKNNTTKN